MSVIECKGLSKTYGRKKALHQVSFMIKENTITGLIGRNGRKNNPSQNYCRFYS